MTQTCPDEDELILLTLGDATENRAMALRAHLERCTRCREVEATLGAVTRMVAAPAASTPVPDVVVAIMTRIEAGERPRTRSTWPNRTWLLSSLGALAAAFSLFWFAPTDPPREAFVARGAPAQRSLRRDVGVTVLRAGERLERITPGSTVSPETSYGVAYTNLGADGSAYLMVFAIDSAGAVHWIQPAYVDPAHNPASLRLSHTAIRKVLSTAEILDAPALGPLRIVTLVSPDPLYVAEVEARVPQSSSELNTRFLGAVVEELTVSVARQPSPKEGEP